MLKRICLLLMALMLAVPAFADEPVWDLQAARLARELPQLARNETYVGICGGYIIVRTHKEQLDALAAQTWTQPLRDVYLSVDMDAVRSMIEAQDASGDMLALFDETTAYVQGMLPGSLMIQALGDEDVMMMLALQNHLYFVDEQEPDGTAYFIRFYADGAPMFFQRSAKDGIGFLNCYPLMDAALAGCASAADVQEWLAAAGIPQLLVAHDEPQCFALYGKSGTDGSKDLDRMAFDLLQSLPDHVNDPLWQSILQESEFSQDVVASWRHAGDEAPVLMAHTQLDAQVQAHYLWGIDVVELMKDEKNPARRLLRASVPMNVAGRLILRKASDVDYVTAVNMNVGSICYNPDQPDGMGIYIFVYEDGRAACALWSATDGIVDMSAMPLPIEVIAECRSAAELSLWFATHHTPPLAFTEVVPK